MVYPMPSLDFSPIRLVLCVSVECVFYFSNMYRDWRKKTKAFAKECRLQSKTIRKKLSKVKDVSKLKTHHKHYLDFIQYFDSLLMDSHWSLELYWETKVSVL